MQDHPHTSFVATARRYILVGIFTLIPIWLTVLLLSVILGFIQDMAAPAMQQLTSGITPGTNIFYDLMLQPWFQTAMAIAGMLLLFYLVGWLASRWIGRQFLKLVDHLMDRIPVAKSVYKTLKRLTDAVQTNPSDIERVVLIEFPSPNMKTVGLVTRTFKDSVTGRELAAVYVPTTPNPTSGYLEIVPVENLVVTNWKLDEAMSFIISGGADVPKRFVWEKSDKLSKSDSDTSKQVEP